MDFPPMAPSTVFGSKYQPLRYFDMRDWLEPRRMTAVMWDHTFLTRHVKGDSFENYDRVLDEAIERGYNTLRIDPIPQSIDLSKPEMVYKQEPMNLPCLPWTRPGGFEGPAGAWLIEFMEKVISRKLYYALSSWWGGGVKPVRHDPHTLVEATVCWIDFLKQWKSRFGFDRCAYVDLNNEFPCFLPGMMAYLEKEGGPSWSPKWQQLAAQQINEAMGIMRKEFPELKFMVSLHGDVRYTPLELEMDCMDIHFYSDADPRWHQRTQFYAFCPDMFTKTHWHAEYSERTAKSHKASAAMYRARQRAKVGEFAAMADARGMPLLTTESWAAWYCIDGPNMDWSWLLDWAEWSVEDAIDFRMWGWTPHNYVQPQFANWKDVRWHRRLTDRFLRS